MKRVDDKIIIHSEEYRRLKSEHELLAILRSYGIEEWENWDKAVAVWIEGMSRSDNR